MLTIAGTGLADGDMPLKAIEALEECDRAYAEFYTNTETIDLEQIERKTGQKIQKLTRSEVEKEQIPVEKAEDKKVVFLVSGDPLSATTHYELKKEAEDRKIETEVVHAPSILTNVAETGLNLYKFGRVVTIPENSAPDSVKDHIEKNTSVGLHSLVLLDIGMTADEAAAKLAEMGFEDRECIVLERAGLESQTITKTTVSAAANDNYEDPPHCLILPGEKSHKEKEYTDIHE